MMFETWVSVALLGLWSCVGVLYNNSRKASRQFKTTRGVELTSVDDLDERQMTAWMKQVAAMPGAGRRKR